MERKKDLSKLSNDQLQNEACKSLHRIAVTEIDVCDDLLHAIMDSNVSPEDRIILIRKAKAIREKVAMLTNAVDFDEEDLH